MQLPKPAVSGSFATFKEIGDSYAGHVVDINGDGTTFSGEKCPQVVLDTADGIITVTCGQAQLWSKTVASVEANELAVGKRAKFTLTQVEKRPNGRTLKHFEIKVADADPAFVPSGPASAADEEPF
jgi:hypothetical protein